MKSSHVVFATSADINQQTSSKPTYKTCLPSSKGHFSSLIIELRSQDEKMVRPNQLEIDRDENYYFCFPCQRFFSTFSGAVNHCRHAATHAGEWCERCDWLFVSQDALHKHITNSARHNICHSCKIDYSNFSDLEVHNVNVHHECTECNERFMNDNNLREVPYDPTTLPLGSQYGLTPL